MNIITKRHSEKLLFQMSPKLYKLYETPNVWYFIAFLCHFFQKFQNFEIFLNIHSKMNATACSSWISVLTNTLFGARVLMNYKIKQKKGVWQNFRSVWAFWDIDISIQHPWISGNRPPYCLYVEKIFSDFGPFWGS